MKKRMLIIGILLAGICTTAIAQDKVVVIPLNSNKVAGTDGQIQYNDGGKSAGAEVYYNKVNGYVGIGPGATSPISNLDIASDSDVKASLRSQTSSMLVVTSEGASKIVSQAYSDSTSNVPVLLGMKARGTSALPTAVQQDDTLLGLFAKGYGDTDFGTLSSASQLFKAAENWSDTARGSYISLSTTEKGTTPIIERMRIDDQGNVGIGTTSPGATLDVAGDIKIRNSVIRFGNDVSHQWTIGPQITDGYVIYANGAAGYVMVMDRNSGNVGIGTTSPLGRLDVNGTIFQRGSQLHADYVFDSKYKLESIEEHAEYMWKEKHLNAVPKAQYDENGLEILEVGSHRKGMLEELEKAHIYIDQLNSQINDLKSEVITFAALKSLVCQDHAEAEACK